MIKTKVFFFLGPAFIQPVRAIFDFRFEKFSFSKKLWLAGQW